jgi:hypothetical protein
MVHSLLIAAALMPAVVTTTAPNAKGLTFARQPLQATGKTRAESRTIYLNREGVTLRPGVNDSTANTSSVVSVPTYITPWDIDDAMWADTVACMRELYGPFDVVVTDVDPGAVPHIEAVFGGHPADVGLPDNVAGVSPFTTDCAVIERSIVFTFTDVMDDDARTMCEVMAQEIAHSYGLDHELLPEDPMTYLEYAGERTFQDEMAACGEFGGRMCGVGGSVCRERQNSHALLTERLGRNPSLPPETDDDSGKGGVSGGCRAAGEGPGLGIGLVLLVGHLVARRRPRDRRHRALLQ